MPTLVKNAIRHFNVVVIEDSGTDARLILGALLKDDRHLRVSILTDGERASKHLREPGWEAELPLLRPDLVFLDLGLPGLDGLEVLQNLRAHERTKSVPIIVFTGANRPEDINRCYDLGANCVTFKPMETELFVSTVKSIGRYWLDVVGPRARERNKAKAWRGRRPPEVDELP